MYNNDNASDPKNGYRFQDAVSLYIFISNIKNNIEKINPEGSYEDVELYFQDGSCSFFQVKHNRHVNDSMKSDKLKKAISVLLDDVINEKDMESYLRELVIVTNSNIPFGRDSDSGFLGDYLKTNCVELSNKEKSRIERQINNLKNEYKSSNNMYDISKINDYFKTLSDHLSIMKLYYFGDDDESRFKQIYKITDELIVNMGLSGQNRTLIKYWKDLFGDVSTKEDRIVTIEKFAAYTEMVAMNSLSESDIDNLINELDIDRVNRQYIKSKYKEELKYFSNDLTIKRKIEKEYKSFRKQNRSIKQDEFFMKFVNNKYNILIDDLGLDNNDDEDRQLARFIIATVVENLMRFKHIEKVLINEN